jgi:hypothetical protein
MRSGSLPSLLATSLLAAACSSTPAPAPVPTPPKEVPAATPEAAAARLGGVWLFAMDRGGQSIDHSLHIALTAGQLVGSLTGPDGNAREISKIALKGDKVSWEIDGQGATQKFEGTLKSVSSMEGTVRMTRGTSAQGEGQPSGGGGYGGRGGGRGGGGRGSRGGGGRSTPQVTWKAFKTVEPAPAPAPAADKSGF